MVDDLGNTIEYNTIRCQAALSMSMPNYRAGLEPRQAGIVVRSPTVPLQHSVKLSYRAGLDGPSHHQLDQLLRFLGGSILCGVLPVEI